MKASARLLPNELMTDEILFDADTPLGFRVRVTQPEWDIIATIKHPVLLGREFDVQQVLQDPDEVRRSFTIRLYLSFTEWNVLAGGFA